MSKVKIETLTPVHVGSGNLLQNNTDFIVEKEGKDSFIHIIDERKILELIGEEHLDNWIFSIEKKESTLNLVKRYAPTSKADDFSRQKITCFAHNIKSEDTLKEIMHNGMGLPYIPGSSIKGAIRTAVMSSLSDKLDEKALVRDIIQRDRNGLPRFDRHGNKLVYANLIEQQLFGKDSNSDIFRFIRVGDAYFENDCVIAVRMQNLNIRNGNDDLWDTKMPQLVEAIGLGEESNLNINIANEYYKWAKPQFSALGELPEELQSIPTLFMLINEHTKQLLEDEISFWNNIDQSGAEIYIEIMQEMLDEIGSSSNGKSCILRVGHASGWRFITGAWTERLDNFNTDVVNATRPRNFRYQDYDFPKTRRVDEDSDVLGFLKLTIEE